MIPFIIMFLIFTLLFLPRDLINTGHWSDIIPYSYIIGSLITIAILLQVR